jgi:hypothetical protein
MWLSLEEHTVWVRGVGGSNPLIPTIFFLIKYAHVAELVDALVLGTSEISRGGSTPSVSTNESYKFRLSI